MNKYEQLIEHIINDNEAKARELFHDIVVEKSRQIYESLMDDEYSENVGSSDVEGMLGDIEADETNDFGRDDMDDMDDMGDEMDMDTMDMDDEEGDEDLEAKVMDLKSELDALKAEFESLMDQEDGDADEEEFDMDSDVESDEDEEMDMDDEEGEEMDDEEMMETSHTSRTSRTAVDLMREYVEKISAPSNTEFTPVGTGAGGDKPAGNTKHLVAGKNDMGGSSANIARGGNEQAPDGTSPKGRADGRLVKNAQEIDVAKRNVNKPGGNKGAQDFYNTKASAKKGEGQTTDGSVPVNKTSIERGGN